MKNMMVEIRPEIEYPQQGETIVSPSYTFRVGAPAGAEGVDVSIDQGPWLACRNAAGYWWFDWSAIEDGEHEIIARTRGPKGRWLMSTPHEFMVATTA